MVGMAIQNSICSPEFSGGVNMVSYGYISSLFPIQVLPAVVPYTHGNPQQSCQPQAEGIEGRGT